MNKFLGIQQYDEQTSFDILSIFIHVLIKCNSLFSFNWKSPTCILWWLILYNIWWFLFFWQKFWCFPSWDHPMILGAEIVIYTCVFRNMNFKSDVNCFWNLPDLALLEILKNLRNSLFDIKSLSCTCKSMNIYKHDYGSSIGS